MGANNLVASYIKFASSFTRAIRTFSLFPPKHPTVIYSIKNLYSALQELLNIKETIMISLSADGHLLVEDQSIDEGELKLIEALCNYFKRLEIESLSFSAGITDSELEAFINVLLTDTKLIKNLGDLNKLFLEKGIQHIKIAQFSYVKVQKGKALLEVEEKKKEFLDRLKNRLKDYSLGKMQRLEDIQSLEGDIISTTAAEFKEKNKLSPVAKNIFKKFLMQSEDRDGVLFKLKSALLDSGCLQEEIDKLIKKIEEEILEKVTAKAKEFEPGVDIEELDKLKVENEKLKSELDRLKKEVGSKTAMLNQLSIETKKVTQEKEQIDNIIHHMAEGLVVVDPQGKIVMLNPVAEKLLGLNKDSIGIPLDKTVKDEHLLTMVKDIKSDKDTVVQRDVELLSPDESTKRVLRTSSAVVEDHNGNTVGMVTILNDITRQREIETMKSDFVASVSHELRTPLATIQQNISLMLKGLAGGLSEDQAKFLNISHDNIERLKRLINDLLDTAAIEAGKLKLRLSMVDLNEIINNVTIFLNKWAQSKKLSLQAELLPEPAVLKIDKDRIEQVITNLIGNAIKFTPEGGKIFVSLARREATEEFSRGALEISVRDTGMGIAPDGLKKIFEKFERAGAVSLGVGGTGLGLSISREIVKIHGGRIGVESKLNEGSTFYFLLPVEVKGSSDKEV